MTAKDYMFKLLKDLDKLGFVLYYYQSYSTSSCYIKLDFGVCNSIRIADHKGKEQYPYTFNLMLNSKVSYEKDGRKYYTASDYDKLIEDIVEFRDNQLSKFGFNYYDYMVKNKNDSVNRKGFWKQSKSYND
jgi:hypothetical protein